MILFTRKLINNIFSKPALYKVRGSNNLKVSCMPSAHRSTILIYHLHIRRKSYFKHKYSVEVETAVNKQINAEQQAAQDYLQIALAFLHPCQARPGAGGFFMRMFNEETDHAQHFLQYQLLRGGMPILSGLSAPNLSMNITLLEAFNRALEMEKTITELLEKVVSVAESVKDYQSVDFITSAFLEEQMHSINEMSYFVTQLARLSDEHSIYHFDLELAKKYPWPLNNKTAR